MCCKQYNSVKHPGVIDMESNWTFVLHRPMKNKFKIFLNYYYFRKMSVLKVF